MPLFYRKTERARCEIYTNREFHLENLCGKFLLLPQAQSYALAGFDIIPAA